LSAPKPLPFDTTVSEDLIWEAAGITKADRAEALAHAFNRTKEALDASVVKVFQYQGEVVTSRPMIDHDTRLKAAKQAASFAGVSERNTQPARSSTWCCRSGPTVGAPRATSRPTKSNRRSTRRASVTSSSLVPSHHPTHSPPSPTTSSTRGRGVSLRSSRHKPDQPGWGAKIGIGPGRTEVS